MTKEAQTITGVVKDIPAITEHPIDPKIRSLAGKPVTVYLDTMRKIDRCPHPFVDVSPADQTEKVRLGVPFIITEDPRLAEAVKSLKP